MCGQWIVNSFSAQPISSTDLISAFFLVNSNCCNPSISQNSCQLPTALLSVLRQEPKITRESPAPPSILWLLWLQAPRGASDFRQFSENSIKGDNSWFASCGRVWQAFRGSNFSAPRLMPRELPRFLVRFKGCRRRKPRESSGSRDFFSRTVISMQELWLNGSAWPRRDFSALAAPAIRQRAKSNG